MNEERQSNNAWFGQPQKEVRTTEPKCLAWAAIERRKKDRATMLGSYHIRKKEERQSNNAWFRPL